MAYSILRRVIHFWSLNLSEILILKAQQDAPVIHLSRAIRY